jgi:RNA recognition motif-containing protein
MHIYIGNLPEELSDVELKGLFEEFGAVSAATIGRDKKTEKSQGYGFVEMPSKSEARAAIEALRGKEIQGKPLRVKALKPDDEFLQHAQSLHGPGRGGFPAGKGTKPARNEGGFRGGAVPRRGGQRGS